MTPNLRRAAVEALRSWHLWERSQRGHGPAWDRLEAAMQELAREVNEYDLEMEALANLFATPREDSP